MRRTPKKQTREVKNDCSWFDTDNARLIILCALFGFVGAHKFAQGKKGQGWLFIILDLTIVGVLVTAIWAFLDLLFLTIKKDNKPGNMIFGAFFLLFGLVVPFTMGCFTSEPTVIEVGKVSGHKNVQKNEKFKNLYKEVDIRGIGDWVVANNVVRIIGENNEEFELFTAKEHDDLRKAYASGAKVIIINSAIGETTNCFAVPIAPLSKTESEFIEKSFIDCVFINENK
jgi:TM2 domain-containing membrane protein YozV